MQALDFNALPSIEYKTCTYEVSSLSKSIQQDYYVYIHLANSLLHFPAWYKGLLLFI
jgi:hypothetical protein